MTLARPAPSLNGDWLKALLVEKRIYTPRMHWTLSDLAFKCLALNISVRAWRHSNPESALCDSEEFYDDAAEVAASILLERLERRSEAWALIREKWLSDHNYIIDHKQKEQTARISTLIAKLSTTIGAIQEIYPSLRPTTRPPVRLKWHHHAAELANDFLGRLQQCNDDPPSGISNNGPVSRYVATVTPFITGETPTVAAVAIYLKARRDSGEIANAGQILGKQIRG